MSSALFHKRLKKEEMRNNIYKFKFLKSQNIIHGVSTKFFGSIKNNGNINKKNLKGFLDAIHLEVKSVVFPEQVHGSSVVTIDDSKKQFIQNADGLITVTKNVFLGVVTADCLPVIFYDEKMGIVGIAHAGYKGILKGILKNMVMSFKKLGSDTKNILVAIGPSIGVCCYDVSIERVEMFENAFKGIKTHKIRNGKYFLDLKNVANKVLLKEGIQEKNIEISPICTKDSLNKFFSFRGEGPENFGEFVTVVGRI